MEATIGNNAHSSLNKSDVGRTSSHQLRDSDNHQPNSPHQTDQRGLAIKLDQNEQCDASKLLRQSQFKGTADRFGIGNEAFQYPITDNTTSTRYNSKHEGEQTIRIDFPTSNIEEQTNTNNSFTKGYNRTISSKATVNRNISVTEAKCGRTRTVSFSLPVTHDENRENQGDHVATCRLHSDGQCTLQFEEILITRKDGSKVLITETEAKYMPHRKEPSRHFCFLKVFSAVAILLFFPLGVPALIYAVRAEKVIRLASVLDLEARSAESHRDIKICERLIIGAIVLGLLTWCFVLLFIEHNLHSNKNNGKHVLLHS